MKIEPLDDKTIKVILSFEDMALYNLDYEKLDYQNPDTKKIILKLLEEIKAVTEIDFSKGKIFIEAFPYIDGGCILYVNLIEAYEKPSDVKKKQGFDTPLIYAIDDIPSLVSLCKRLNEYFGHIILKSSVYYMNSKYYLFIYTYFKMDEQISCLLDEYGEFFGKGTIKSSYIKEQSKEILEQNAIKLLDL